MTWYGDDAKIYLGGEGRDKNTTIAYDDKGKQYPYKQIPISVAGGSWSIYGFDPTLFPTDVPLKVRLEIQNVSEAVSTFKRIQISIRDMNDPITLYNVPIERANEVTSISNQVAPDEVLPDNSTLIAEQEDTQKLPKLKRIIGKWTLVSLKKDGKEITFKPCTFQFYDKSNDDPYTKDMTETISGKARSTGYTIMPDNDNELIATLFITDDECDNSYTIQTVDSEKLILSFGYYGDPKIQGELIFKKANV